MEIKVMVKDKEKAEKVEVKRTKKPIKLGQQGLIMTWGRVVVKIKQRLTS